MTIHMLRNIYGRLGLSKVGSIHDSEKNKQGCIFKYLPEWYELCKLHPNNHQELY